jgi:glycosyltransferase involved in cell wall biosynthesis
MNLAANRWVDGQTAITGRMAEAVGIPPERLWGIWPSGVNADQFARARQRHWPAEGESIQLIYVGAIFQERNLMGLCRAVEAANAAGLSFGFTIVGDGPEREALSDYAARTGGRIRVLPPVAHVQVPDLLARAHVGVLPFPDEPKFRVSSPIKLFEYMAAGMPILATRIVCHTDVVGDTSTAFWAEPNGDEGLYAALTHCWQAREELRVMGERSAIAVNDWTWTAAARKLNDALIRGLEAASAGKSKKKSKAAVMTTKSTPQ